MKKQFTTNKTNLAGVLMDFFKFLMTSERFYSSMAKVLSVNEAEKTATVEIIGGEEELEGVRLEQSATENGFFIKPAVGSVVLISWSDQTTAFIDLFSEIELVVFQGGTNGGLIKIADIVGKLNNLESKVNEIINFTATHAHAGVTTGAGTSGPTSTPVTGELTPTQQADLENENFKH